MKVLVTGANGHLGANVTRTLLARNHKVSGTVRAGADLRGLEGLAIKLFETDILNVEGVMGAAWGMDAIIHLATPFVYNVDPEKILGPAMEGTRNVFEAAARHKVGRVVVASSVAAVGPAIRPDEIRTELDWNESPEAPYLQAKTDSERLAWKLSKEFNIPLITLCPANMIGPYDYRVTPSMRYLQQLLENTAPAPRGGINQVDVRDVAEAFALALETDKVGERFIVAGEIMTYRELSYRVETITGKQAMYLPTPRWMALAFVKMQELLGADVNYQGAVSSVDRYQNYDNSKAIRELGFRSRPIEESLRDSAQWFLDAGLIKGKTAEALRKVLRK